METIQSEGKNVEEAIEKGLSQLNASREEVEIKILEEGSAGLFGLMGTKPACVQMAVKGNGKASVIAVSKKESAVVGGLPKSLAEKMAVEVLEELLRLMNMKVSEIRSSSEPGKVDIEIRSEDKALLIGREGQTLEALNLITSLMISREESTRSRVRIDVEGYRARIEKQISENVKLIAAQVKDTGRPHRFEPMNPAERRIIHTTLQDDPQLETFSEGEGRLRRVVIQLKDSK